MRKNSRSHTKATGGNETTPQKKAQVLTKLAKLGLESATRSRAPKEPRDYEEIEIFLDSESETEVMLLLTKTRLRSKCGKPRKSRFDTA